MLYNLPETGVTGACQRAWLQKVLRNPVCGVLPARAGTWSRHCSSTSAASRSTSPSPAPHVVAGAYGKTPREKSSGKAPGKFCPTRRRRSLAARSGLLPGQLSRRAALQRRACPRRCRGGTLVGRRRGSGREGEGVRGVLRADPEQRVRLAVAWPPLKLGGPRAQRARPQVGGGGAGGLSQRAMSCTNGARRRAVGWGGSVSVLRRRHMPHAHAHAACTCTCACSPPSNLQNPRVGLGVCSRSGTRRRDELPAQEQGLRLLLALGLPLPYAVRHRAEEGARRAYGGVQMRSRDGPGGPRKVGRRAAPPTHLRV